MPIHLNDLDVVSEAEGLRSALIVPCNMCPAVTVAVREKKPFIQFFRNFLKSAPFENYIKALQSRLKDHGVRTKVFRSDIPHQWFLCMWTSSRRKKLLKHAKKYDAVRLALQKQLPPTTDMMKRGHLIIIKHGRQICKAQTPECYRCPIHTLCPYQPKTKPKQNQPVI